MSAHPTTQKIHEYMHRDIVTIAPEATLQEASQVMKEMGVGALLVKEKKAYVGILSETQLTREGMAKGFNAKTHSVRNIMKKTMVSIESNQSLTEAREMMRTSCSRHLIVTEKGKIVGIITLSDLIRYYAQFFQVFMDAAGLPVSKSDHAEATAEMALDMLRIIEDPRYTDRQLHLRIGINSGPVVAGVIGKRKFTYDLWGDTVNTANRMETYGLPNQIHVSDTTFELLRGKYRLEPREEIDVAGKGKMKTFWLKGRLD